VSTRDSSVHILLPANKYIISYSASVPRFSDKDVTLAGCTVSLNSFYFSTTNKTCLPRYCQSKLTTDLEPQFRHMCRYTHTGTDPRITIVAEGWHRGLNTPHPSLRVFLDRLQNCQHQAQIHSIQLAVGSVFQSIVGQLICSSTLIFGTSKTATTWRYQPHQIHREQQSLACCLRKLKWFSYALWCIVSWLDSIQCRELHT